MKTVLRLHNICEEVNFYLGYTKIYEKEWVADEKKLKKMGVVVLHIMNVKHVFASLILK